MTGRHGYLMSGPLPQLYESRSEAKELVAGWGEGRTSFIPNEKRSSKLLLQETYARADGCLCDMQTLSRFDEAPSRDDLEKCPSELDVHFSSNTKDAFKCQINS